MSHTAVVKHSGHGDTSKLTLGFWLYLMTDCLLFASLFATYAVLQVGTAGGPSSSDIVDLPFVLVETIILLTSSFTCGLAMLALQRSNARQVITWLSVTGMLGLAFLGMEMYEFTHLIQEGYSWQRSGFLSAFFTLVGTHGLHILVGLIWLAVMIVRIAAKGLIPSISRKLQLFSLFWHFLDVIWIFIFTVVYMIGAL